MTEHPNIMEEDTKQKTVDHEEHVSPSPTTPASSTYGTPVNEVGNGNAYTPDVAPEHDPTTPVEGLTLDQSPVTPATSTPQVTPVTPATPTTPITSDINETPTNPTEIHFSTPDLTSTDEPSTPLEGNIINGKPSPLNIEDDNTRGLSQDMEFASIEAVDEGSHDEDELGTPTGVGPSSVFGEDGDEYSSHRFFGPSNPSDSSSSRCLHGIRWVNLHANPPKFVSDTPSQLKAHVPRPASGRSQSVPDITNPVQAEPVLPNAYSVTFTEPVLGFRTGLVLGDHDELNCLVTSVEKDTPASKAGVIVGDGLLRVNQQSIQPHMTEEQVQQLLDESLQPRTILFARSCAQLEEELLADESVLNSKSLNFAEKKPPVVPLFGRLKIGAKHLGSAIVSTALKRKKAIVHEGFYCNGCGMDPIQGALWTCSVCTRYNLCEECYTHGIHGMENSEAMHSLDEALVQEKLQHRCKRLTPEFLLSLRRDVCKGRVDKFEYMGGWIADIVSGTAASKITVRGIEIPTLTPSARQRFVSHLMPLVSNRTDIEVNIEWLPDDSERPSVEEEEEEEQEEKVEEGEEEKPAVVYEKLRIWISDKKTRTTSPFL